MLEAVFHSFNISAHMLYVAVEHSELIPKQAIAENSTKEIMSQMLYLEY